MSTAIVSRWQSDRLQVRDDCDLVPAQLLAADSWLVTDGAVRALELHRQRFAEAAGRDIAAFWDAAIAAIPRTGDWFPRVELRRTAEGDELLFRLREAPERMPSVVLATHAGRDPRTQPRIKGPDLEAMTRLRTEVQARGAEEAVLLSPDGFLMEGSTSCLLWWRGDAIAVPSPELPRIDSVTLRSVLAVAAGLGVDVLSEDARPEELDQTELWALNALKGIRIVTRWIDGPELAQQPGRLTTWRARLDALRTRLPPLPAAD